EMYRREPVMICCQAEFGGRGSMNKCVFVTPAEQNRISRSCDVVQFRVSKDTSPEGFEMQKQDRTDLGLGITTQIAISYCLINASWLDTNTYSREEDVNNKSAQAFYRLFFVTHPACRECPSLDFQLESQKALENRFLKWCEERRAHIDLMSGDCQSFSISICARQLQQDLEERKERKKQFIFYIKSLKTQKKIRLLLEDGHRVNGNNIKGLKSLVMLPNREMISWEYRLEKKLWSQPVPFGFSPPMTLKEHSFQCRQQDPCGTISTHEELQATSLVMLPDAHINTSTTLEGWFYQETEKCAIAIMNPVETARSDFILKESCTQDGGKAPCHGQGAREEQHQMALQAWSQWQLSPSPSWFHPAQLKALLLGSAIPWELRELDQEHPGAQGREILKEQRAKGHGGSLVAVQRHSSGKTASFSWCKVTATAAVSGPNLEVFTQTMTAGAGRGLRAAESSEIKCRLKQIMSVLVIPMKSTFCRVVLGCVADLLSTYPNEGSIGSQKRNGFESASE
ncbi:hypothetical protein EK904_010728, partial [Melospiza melodia maxima]